MDFKVTFPNPKNLVLKFCKQNLMSSYQKIAPKSKQKITQTDRD